MQIDILMKKRLPEIPDEIFLCFIMKTNKDMFLQFFYGTVAYTAVLFLLLCKNEHLDLT